MPTLEDWRSIEPDSETTKIAVAIFGLRPEWLGRCNVDEWELCRFESPVEGVEPLVLELDEITLYWGKWHNFFYEAYIDVETAAQRAVETIEDILSGGLIRIVAFADDGRWVGSMLAESFEASLTLAVRTFGPVVMRVAVARWDQSSV